MPPQIATPACVASAEKQRPPEGGLAASRRSDWGHRLRIHAFTAALKLLPAIANGPRSCYSLLNSFAWVSFMTGIVGSAEWIKDLRAEIGATQAELAERLDVTYVTISRWENGQARPNRLAMRALLALVQQSTDGHRPPSGSIGESRTEYVASHAPITDFRADAEAVRAFVEGERLCYGHLFSPGFGTETALI